MTEKEIVCPNCNYLITINYIGNIDEWLDREEEKYLRLKDNES